MARDSNMHLSQVINHQGDRAQAAVNAARGPIGCGLLVVFSCAVTTLNHGDGAGVFRTSSQVEATPLSDGGAMLVDVDSGTCWQLNRVGAELWERLARGSSLEVVIEEFTVRYAIPRDTLMRDVESIVNDLCRHGLLSPAPKNS